MKVLHYVNQFFGGVGGEDHANDPPKVVDGAVGPGRALQAALGKRGNVVATIICGDNFSVEQADKTRAFVLDVIKKHQPDAIVAGPAFDAGRYGLACGLICQIAKQAGVHALTAMQHDNAGVTVYRKDIVCVPTGANVAEMPKIMPRLADLAVKLASGHKLGSAAQEGYIPTGHRRDFMREKSGAERAVEMVLARIQGKPFTSEIIIRDYDLVPPLPPMKTLQGVKVGIVTSGGLVPSGNPDRIPAARAEWFGRYDISKMPELKVGEWETIHGGYGHKYVNERDPNYVVPLRSLRELERRGEIGSIYPWYIATVGNQTAVNEARKMGRLIAQEFKANGVGAVVLVPT